MDVVAQLVRTTWTKRSRGGAPATRRATAPVGFLLPSTAPPVFHRVRMDEHQDFEPLAEVLADLPNSVLVREQDTGLLVHAVIDPFGRPRRHRRPPAVRLALGEWVGWQVNYRYTNPYRGDWTYALDTLNIAYGPAAQNAFLGDATYYVDERGHLR